MSRFNTGNPIDSADPRDLSDNAKNLDQGINSNDPTFTDRLGNSRQSWAGMESEFQSAQDDKQQRFNTFIASSGYEFVGDYDTGIELTEYNQVVRDSEGEFWRVSGSTELPYTATGAGLPEGGAFVTVGDAALRQDLDGDVATGQGARLVRGAVIYVDTVADLQALDTSGLVDGQQVQVKEYHAGTGVGGGEFYWDATSTDDENGVTLFGDGSGRWRRQVPDSGLTPEMGGAISGEEATEICEKVARLCHDGDTILYTFRTLPDTNFLISDDLNLRRIRMECDGRFTLTTPTAMVLMGGRAQNPDNPKQRLKRVNRSVTANEGVPEIRIVGAKNQYIEIERANTVQIWASTTNSNLDGSTAYSNFGFKHISELNFDTDPDTTGSSVQWINENQFHVDRISRVNIRGSYGHNNNKFYGGSFENNALINIEIGSSNHFYGVRLEGSGNQVYFGEQTRNNKIIESRSENVNWDEELAINASVTNDGRTSNQVITMSGATKNRATIYSIGLKDPFDVNQVPVISPNFPNDSRRRGNLSNLTATRTFASLASTDLIPVTKGDVVSVAAEGGQYGFYAFFYDSDVRPVDVTYSATGYSSDILGRQGQSVTGNRVGTNTRAETSGWLVNTSSVRYMVVSINAGGSLGNDTATSIKVSILSATPTSFNIKRGCIGVTAPPSQGYAPRGHVWQNVNNGDEYLCMYSLDTNLSETANGGDTAITVSGHLDPLDPRSSLDNAEPGDIVGVQSDDYRTTLWTTVDSVDSGAATITLSDPIGQESSAGNRVVVMRWLTRSAT